MKKGGGRRELDRSHGSSRKQRKFVKGSKRPNVYFVTTAPLVAGGPKGGAGACRGRCSSSVGTRWVAVTGASRGCGLSFNLAATSTGTPAKQPSNQLTSVADALDDDLEPRSSLIS